MIWIQLLMFIVSIWTGFVGAWGWAWATGLMFIMFLLVEASE